jgi:hypothetical protein
MPTVQVTATVEVEEGTTLAALDDAVARALNKAGRELIAQAMPVLEERALEDAGGARQRPEPRYVLTRFGEVRFNRWKVKAAGGHVHFLDQALGLRPTRACPRSWPRSSPSSARCSRSARRPPCCPGSWGSGSTTEGCGGRPGRPGER